MELILIGLALWVLLLFPLVEFEKSGFAFLTVIVGLALLQVFGGVDVTGTILRDPLSLILWVAAYLLVGIGYSLLRWNWYCSAWRRDYDATDPGYQKDILWKNQPAAASSKNRIITWMMFWPWSAFWWFLSDFITEVFERIYRSFSSVYERIAQRHLKGIAPPPTKS